MSLPCTQADRLARIEGKLDIVVQQLGDAGDPLTGKAPSGLVAIVLEQQRVSARVTALESIGEAARVKHKAIVAAAAKVLVPLLFGAGIAKADSIVALIGALLK